MSGVLCPSWAATAAAISTTAAAAAAAAATVEVAAGGGPSQLDEGSIAACAAPRVRDLAFGGLHHDAGPGAQCSCLQRWRRRRAASTRCVSYAIYFASQPSLFCLWVVVVVVGE